MSKLVLKVDREMDELTMALRNLEHPGRCRGCKVVPWKYAFKGNLEPQKKKRARRGSLAPNDGAKT
jgi:hypothetical protein